MKAAIVETPGAAPVYGTRADPVAGPGEAVVRMRAAALTHLVRGRASGRHYSAGARTDFVPGVDGIGHLEDGRRVAVLLPHAPHGTMAERTVAPFARCVDVPDGLDDVAAAAIINPGMSSWAALGERAGLVRGETVLVNGATGAAGRLAIAIAKHLGARTVIATGRSEAGLQAAIACGADAAIPLLQPDDARARAFADAFAEGVDVVLDYLWGPSAEALLAAIDAASERARAVRYVQIGNASGAAITLRAPVLRATGLALMGSGLGSVSLERLVASVAGMLQAAPSLAAAAMPTRAVPLADVERVWGEAEDGRRIVFVMDAS